MRMKKIIIIALFFSGMTALSQPFNQIEVVKVNVERTPAKEPRPQKIQETFETTMIAAFKAGNATKIASWFGDNVDLSILDKENLYSKSQAEQILKTFFTTHKPSEFTVLHKGKSGASQYFVCSLTASDGNYRVTLNTKPSGTATVITSLTIESE